jgi:Zn-dependent protease
MSEGALPARPRGPWDPPEGAAPAKVEAAPVEEAPRQPLIWAILSTLLLAGWIAWVMGWQWAVAGVVGVFVHEYGHVLAINALGCGPGRIHIVPFLGGAAHMARHPSSDFKGVLISLAGPTFGLLAAIPFFLAGYYLQDRTWTGGAFFIAIINLINLLPAPPLDGSKALGPALARVHPMLERAALLLVGSGAVLWALNARMYIFAAFIGFGVFSALVAARFRAPAIPLNGRQWVSTLLLYVLSVAACVAVMLLAMNSMGDSDRVMRILRLDFSPS